MTEVARRGAHHLWPGLVAILAGFCILQGAGYTVLGNRNAGPGTLVIRSYVPGGMHTHGVLVLVLGAWLLYALGVSRTGRSQPIRWGIVAGLVYSLAFTCSVLGSWALYGPPWVNGGAPWGSGPGAWALAGALFHLAAANMPRTGGRGDG